MSRTLDNLYNAMQRAHQAGVNIRQASAIDGNYGKLLLAGQAAKKLKQEAEDNAKTSLAVNEGTTQQQLALADASEAYERADRRHTAITGGISALGGAVLKRMKDAEFDAKQEKLRQEREEAAAKLPKPAVEKYATILQDQIKALDQRLKQMGVPETPDPNKQVSSTSVPTGEILKTSYTPKNPRLQAYGVNEFIHGLNPNRPGSTVTIQGFDSSGGHSGSHGHHHSAYSSVEHFKKALERHKRAGYKISTGRTNDPGSHHFITQGAPDGVAIDAPYIYPAGHPQAGQFVPETVEAEEAWHRAYMNAIFPDLNSFI